MDRSRSFQSQGFTLLELLVVISIVGLLLAMSIVSFTTAQQRGRDARRRGDINNMQRAMEQQFAKSSGYTTSCTTTLTWLPSGVLPTDPQGTANPYVLTCTSATAYCFCAKLEGADGNSTNNSCTAYVNGTGTFYCLGNQQ